AAPEIASETGYEISAAVSINNEQGSPAKIPPIILPDTISGRFGHGIVIKSAAIETPQIKKVVKQKILSFFRRQPRIIIGRIAAPTTAATVSIEDTIPPVVSEK
ncbi:MAG: hypothetical protein EZS28_053080, partial [Streblomastix strix]